MFCFKVFFSPTGWTKSSFAAHFSTEPSGCRFALLQWRPLPPVASLRPLPPPSLSRPPGVPLVHRRARRCQCRDAECGRRGSRRPEARQPPSIRTLPTGAVRKPTASDHLPSAIQHSIFALIYHPLPQPGLARTQQKN